MKWSFLRALNREGKAWDWRREKDPFTWRPPVSRDGAAQQVGENRRACHAGEHASKSEDADDMGGVRR